MTYEYSNEGASSSLPEGRGGRSFVTGISDLGLTGPTPRGEFGSNEVATFGDAPNL